MVLTSRTIDLRRRQASSGDWRLTLAVLPLAVVFGSLTFVRSLFPRRAMYCIVLSLGCFLCAAMCSSTTCFAALFPVCSGRVSVDMAKLADEPVAGIVQ